jgi:hypothetical protein
LMAIEFGLIGGWVVPRNLMRDETI